MKAHHALPPWHRRKLSKSHNVSIHHPCVFAVACPYCLAKPGQTCRAPSIRNNREFMTEAPHTHVARLKASGLGGR